MFDWFPVSFRGRMAYLIGSLYRNKSFRLEKSGSYVLIQTASNTPTFHTCTTTLKEGQGSFFVIKNYLRYFATISMSLFRLLFVIIESKSRNYIEKCCNTYIFLISVTVTPET